MLALQKIGLLILLLLQGLMPCAAAQVADDVKDYAAVHTLGQTSDDTPTWQDLGLKDLLAAPGTSSVEAPQSASHHITTHPGRSCATHTSACPVHTHYTLIHQPLLASRPCDYYIYFLYRLRL